MEQLQKAAEVLMAPPNVVNSEQRHEAEQIFLQLRSTKNPFTLCCDLLENSQNHYLLFEAATILRLAIIREWKEHTKENILQLRQYIFHYVLKHPTLPHFVLQTLVQVIAIMIKRGSVDDMGEDRGRLLGEIEQLISSPDNSMRIIGCSIISAMLQEYSVTVKSTDICLTLDTHFKVKRQFEETDLRRIFHFVVNMITELIKYEGKIEPQLKLLLSRLICIAEKTLLWNFVPKFMSYRLFPLAFQQDESPSLRPGKQWTEIFLDQNIIQLFFKLYWKVRDEWDLGHYALNCLVQLASLNGKIFDSKDFQLKYTTQYLECFFSFLSSIKITEVESLGISNIFRKLLLFSTPKVLFKLPEGMVVQLLDQITNLACNFIRKVALDEMFNKEDKLFIEAFDVLLQSWASILPEDNEKNVNQLLVDGGKVFKCEDGQLSLIPTRDTGHASGCVREHIKRNSVQIFDIYVECRLSSLNDAEEIVDFVPLDRVAYRDQLIIIGLCGRQAPEKSLPMLIKPLEERISKLRVHLSHVASNNIALNEMQINSLHEDIHWLLLIAGFVTCSDYSHEIAMIPPEVLKLSIDASPNVNLEATLTLMAHPSQSPAEIPNSSNADPIVRFMSAVLRLSDTESQAVSANMGHHLSPEVSSSMMWFLKRFCSCYIYHKESIYPQLSVALSSAFGQDSECANWILNYLMKKVEEILLHRSAEPSLVDDTVNFLVTMVDNKERGRYLVKSGSLITLIKLQQTGRLAFLSSAAQKGLLKGLVMSAASLPDAEERQQYFQHVVDPVVAAFRSLVTNGSFPKHYEQENIKKQVVFHIDNFIGMVQGSLMPTAEELFQRFVICLGDAVKLLDLYHNYSVIVEIVIELFVECGRRMLCYLSRVASKQMYDLSVQLVSTYAKHNIGKRVIDAQSEDHWRDLQLLMELLTSLLSKDIFDFSPSDPEEEESEAVVAAADVSLYGLNIIMPLMSRDLLQLPTLSSEYYKMVYYIAERSPSKIANLHVDLLKNLLMSIELGLTTYGPEIGSTCFDFIVEVGCYLHRERAMDACITPLLRPFLKLILDLLLTEQVSSDMLQLASGALYTLICCYQSEYQELVRTLIDRQTNATTGQQLAQAFNELTHEVVLSTVVYDKLRFRRNFQNFIPKVRGFFLVK